MSMPFCSLCGALMVPKERDGESFLECSSCGFIDYLKITSSEKVEKSSEGVDVIDDKNIFATYSNTCKKCGYEKAEIIDMGIFYSDEDNLIMLKCGKCGFSERIGRKTS